MKKYGKRPGSKRYPRYLRQKQSTARCKVEDSAVRTTALEDWKVNQPYWLDCAKAKLEFSYSPKDIGLREEIVRGLAAWRFLGHVARRYYYRTSDSERMERAEFLNHLMSSESRFERLVGYSEALPVSAWRKILWRENIDFASMESFFRRLSEAQYQVIADNYFDFSAGQIPRIFTQVEIRRDNITIESLKDEPVNWHKHYLSKSAMSYNLLGLDFGFNAYPKGIADDLKIVEVSPLRFLSVKNHADDFVVNTESGRYWRMYKSARSNYVYRPNRRVELSTHVCPGFWWTLMMHFWFWILSPLLTAGIVVTGSSINIGALKASLGMPVTVVALTALVLITGLTPLWCLAAVIKKMLISIADIDIPAPKFINKLFDFISLNEEFFKGSALVFGICVLAAFLAIGEYYLYSFLHGSFSLAETLIIMVPVQMLLGYLVATESYQRNWPWYIKVPPTFEALLLICALVKTFRSEILAVLQQAWQFVAVWLLRAIILLWETIAVMGVAWLFFLIPVILLTWLIVALATMAPEKQAKVDYWIEKLSVAGFWFSVLAFVGGLTWIILSHKFDLQLIGGLVIFSVLSGVISWLLSSYSHNLNPEVKEIRTSFGIESDKRFGKSHRYCLAALENQYLKSLEREERNKLINRLHSWCFGYMANKNGEAYYFLLARIDEKLMTRLEAASEEFVYVNYKLYFETVKLFALEGLSFKEARDRAQELDSKFESRVQKTRACLLTLVWPAIKLFELACFFGRGVWYCLKKLGEIFVTLYRLYELFNKRCPYVAQSRVLE